MNKRILYFFTIIVLSSQLYAQIPVGQWRTHFAYYRSKRVVEAGDRIFCITEGGLVYHDKRENASYALTTLDGLSGYNVTAVGYDPESDIVIITFSDGNINLIDNKKLYTLSDISRKTNIINKSINNIFVKEGIAYLSCGFGIVLLDIQQRLIVDTWYIGDSGSELEVYEIAYSDEYIYAATENGVRRTLTNLQPADYLNWEHINFVPEPDTKCTELFKVEAGIGVTYLKGGAYYQYLLENDNSNTNLNLIYRSNHVYTNVVNDHLVVCNNSVVRVYDLNLNPLGAYGNIVGPFEGIVDSDGILWVASVYYGLVNISDGEIVYHLINGPIDNRSGQIVNANDKIYVAGGNEGALFNYNGVYLFEDERWNNFYNFLSGNDKFPNISRLAVDPFNSNRVFGASWRYGLVEFNNTEIVNVFDAYNSPLQIVDNTTPRPEQTDIRITGMDFDSKGNLWLACNYASSPIVVYTADREWINIELDYDNFGLTDNIYDFIVDEYDQKWLLLRDNGILLFKEVNDNFSDFEERNVLLRWQEGTKNVGYCFSEDTNKNMWVGTDEGPIVFYNNPNLISEEEIKGFQPSIPRNDGSGFIDYLLSTIQIVDMEFDGGNRLWCATATAGVFLISENGQEEIHHFTTENSPLPSNILSCIGINHKTGEVFFGTDNGLVSYRSNSTKGSDKFGDVYVFPNPVKPEYEGDIHIVNLAQNSKVKITDISGNLVYETTAIGAMATWNGIDLWGKEVNTGVYLVFCNNEDGTESYVTKFLYVK